MSNVLIDRQKIDILANAISDKSGVPVTMTLDEMVEAVDGIETGGGEPNLQAKTYTVDSAGTETITADSGYDGLSEVEVSVPQADFAPFVHGQFDTQSGERKWHAIGGGYAEAAGWIDEGPQDASEYYPIVSANTSVTPSESSQTIGGWRYMMEGAVTVNAIPSNYVGSGITQRSSSDLTASGATVTVPSGYYSAQASKAVASGTAGTPTATKGTVSNHSVSVTPSVTNTSGYISGGTINGTAVTVSASELVSGTYTVDSSGSKDVTNYASASVPTGTAGTPSASKGAVSNHSVSVTPSVTNTTGWITGSTKTGTAVTVTAAELVSGTYTIDSGGTKDVTNYANVSVPTMTLPTHTSSTSIGDTKGQFIPSLSTSYINIPAGFNNTAQHYVLSPASVMPLSITENGVYDASDLQYDVTGFNVVTVNVSGGGGGSSPQFASKSIPLSTASASISFTGLLGEPTTFSIMAQNELATPTGTPYKVAMVVYDGTSLHGQTITNTNNAQVTYDSSSFSKSYSNGTLTVTSTGPYFQAMNYVILYTYDGSITNVHTKDVQVGSGATSITFTGLEDEPLFWTCIFKSNFSTSSGYQRAIGVHFDPEDGFFGLEMDSSAKYTYQHYSATYSNGSLTITSQGTNAGGYFHQPGYYQLTYVYDNGSGEASSITTEPLSVTTNGTYTAPNGKAYTPVYVNVSGANIDTKTLTNSTATATSLQFTSMLGQPKAFFLRLTAQIARSSSYRYYYVENVRYNGTNTNGRYFYQYNGTLYNDTTHYSYSYSGTTLTISSTGSQSGAGGSFYNGTYELVYIY